MHLQNDEAPLKFAWATHVEWMATPIAAQVQNVTFFRAGNSIFKIQIPSEVIPQLADIEKWRVTYSSLFDLLHGRGLIVKIAKNTLKVKIFVKERTLFHTITIPSAQNLECILLAGDEENLTQFYDQFHLECPYESLISWIRISGDQIVVGPVRFKDEAELPTQVGRSPRIYPGWKQRLQGSILLISELFKISVEGPLWYSLTSRGFRMDYHWNEMKHPFRVNTQLLPRLQESIPLSYAQAGVENKITSGGVGETPDEAKHTATCEAWERYCLDRSDLAFEACGKNAPEISPSLEGVFSRYLSTLAGPIYGAPKYVKGHFLESGLECAVPAQWIYFQENSSALNSTGVAYGLTLQDAEYYARLELIERHILVSVFLGLTFSQPIDIKLDPRSFSSKIAEKREVRWYSLGEINQTQTVICLLNNSEPPFSMVGAATRTTLEEAAQKAFWEAAAAELIWGHRIAQLGRQSFVNRGQKLMKGLPSKMGLLESAWMWAAEENSAEKLHSIFDNSLPHPKDLNPDQFISVDIGNKIVPLGAVVKVIHPHALPLPSFYSHLIHLAQMLGVKTPLPLPIT